MRHKEILIKIKEIEKIEESINTKIDESISKKDLLAAIEINRLEGQIGDLRMKNFIDLSQSHEATIPEFIPIILLVSISMQIGLIAKKYRTNLPE